MPITTLEKELWKKLYLKHDFSTAFSSKKYNNYMIFKVNKKKNYWKILSSLQLIIQ